MKTIAYTALHYGIDYLGDAIRSVIDHVDEYHVLYAAVGSHGHRADAICPETRTQLLNCASSAAGKKLHWHDGEWAHEGAQRNSIYAVAPDADVILVLDADEIWPRRLVESVLHDAEMMLYDPPRRTLRLPMIHFWRSFYRAVLHDPALPERVVFPRIDQTFGAGYASLDLPPICHMGYAQRSEIVRYKLLTHGHYNELRQDWYETRWVTNAQKDCHPVGSEYWTPELVDPLQYLPSSMVGHPYFDMEVIP